MSETSITVDIVVYFLAVFSLVNVAWNMIQIFQALRRHCNPLNRSIEELLNTMQQGINEIRETVHENSKQLSSQEERYKTLRTVTKMDGVQIPRALLKEVDYLRKIQTQTNGRLDKLFKLLQTTMESVASFATTTLSSSKQQQSDSSGGGVGNTTNTTTTTTTTLLTKKKKKKPHTTTIAPLEEVLLHRFANLELEQQASQPSPPDSTSSPDYPQQQQSHSS